MSHPSVAIVKRMDCEELKYSDYMYGKEEFTDQVWEYVEECENIGREKFKLKYNGEKFHQSF